MKNAAGLTERQEKILRALGYRAVFNLEPITCRRLSEVEFRRYQTWAMRDLRALELRKFVEKADPNRYNDIAWRITDAGLERLARDKDNPLYRGAFRGSGNPSSTTGP